MKGHKTLVYNIHYASKWQNFRFFLLCELKIEGRRCKNKGMKKSSNAVFY